jgi:hypothetical protein
MKGGFGADMNEAADAGLLGSSAHTPGALDIDAIPGVRRPPLLDKRGAMDHDVGASTSAAITVSRSHRTGSAPIAPIFWLLDDDRDMARIR